MERLHIAKNRVNDPMHFTKLLLLLSKLRALDALSKYKTKRQFFPHMFVCIYNLVAERLLCLQMNTDGQVQKCIFEVLHREATNVVVVC